MERMLITISGPAKAGKTVAAAVVTKALREAGYEVHLVGDDAGVVEGLTGEPQRLEPGRHVSLRTVQTPRETLSRVEWERSEYHLFQLANSVAQIEADRLRSITMGVAPRKDPAVLRALFELREHLNGLELGSASAKV